MKWKGVQPEAFKHTSYVGLKIFLIIFSSFFLAGGILGTITLGRNVFDKQDWLSGIFLIIPILFGCLGAGGLLLTVWCIPWKGKVSASISGNASTANETAGVIVSFLAYAFFGVFFAAGIGMLVNGCLIPLGKIMDAMTWSQVPCVIIEGTIEKRIGSDSVAYAPVIRYRYDTGGKEVISNRLAPIDYAVRSRKDAESLLEHYPPGSERRCWVNPRDPAGSVLFLGGFPGDQFIFGLMGLVFVGVGGGGIFFVRTKVKEWKERQDGKAEKRASGSETPPLTPEDRRRGPTHGLKLKPKETPLRKFLFTLVVTLVWNGFMGAVAWLCWTGERVSIPWWGMGLIGLFGLIGLLMIWGLGGAFLALFAPYPVITIDRKRILLGEPFRVSWKFSGSEQDVPALSLYVEGVEEAKSGAGSDMKTDTHTFAHIPVAALAGRAAFVRGSQTVTIPANSMHSFHGDHNAIRWEIRLKTDVAGTRSLDERYEIEVSPLPAAAGKRA